MRDVKLLSDEFDELEIERRVAEVRYINGHLVAVRAKRKRMLHHALRRKRHNSSDESFESVRVNKTR